MKLLTKLTLILLLSFIAIKSYLSSDNNTEANKTTWGSVKEQWMQIKSLALLSKEKLLKKQNEEQVAAALEQAKSDTKKKTNEEEGTQQEKTIFYRWKDKKGQVHISETPPKHNPYEEVSVRKINTFSSTTEQKKESTKSEEDLSAESVLSSAKLLVKISSLFEQLKQTHDEINQRNESAQEKK